MITHDHNALTAELFPRPGCRDYRGLEPRVLQSGLIIDGYQVQDVLAITASSEIAEAAVQETGEAVALKVPRTAQGAEFLRREIRIHRLMGEQSFVAAMVGSGAADDGMPFIATRLQENGTLADIVRVAEQSTQLPDSEELQRRIRLMSHCALGLRALHGIHFIHCDIKPANVGVGSDGIGRLLDFGVAELEDDIAAGAVAVQGTLGQSVAPEGFRGELSVQSDVWAIGATTFSVLTGQSAFSAPAERDAIGYYQVVAQGPRSSLHEIGVEISSDVDSVVTASLHPDPRERPTLEEVQQVYQQAA